MLTRALFWRTERRMILRLLLYCTLAHLTAVETTKCLSGHMTDVQDWVTKDGALTGTLGERSIDLSGNEDAVQELQSLLETIRKGSTASCVTQLSLSRCGLTAIPQVFRFTNGDQRTLAESLQHLTLYGNNFYQASQPATLYEASFNATDAVEVVLTDRSQSGTQQWAAALTTYRFPALLELDLRSCCIKTLHNDTFRSMPVLEALYLADNYIVHIETSAFSGLSNLLHLDLSNNNFQSALGSSDSMQIDSPNIFDPLTKLGSLDFSNTKLTQANVMIFRTVPSCLERLSICNTGITSLGSAFLSNTDIKYLDVSGNAQILSVDNQRFIENLSKTLVVLYADHTGLQTLNSLRDFGNLEILKISNNVVSLVQAHLVSSWKKLNILDLTSNRIPVWFGPLYKNIPHLKFLSLIKNNLNMISEVMMHDLSHISYIGLSDNFFVCSCNVREFLDASITAEKKMKHTATMNNSTSLFDRRFFHRTEDDVQDKKSHKALDFHTGYSDYEDIITRRTAPKCPNEGYCGYNEHNSSYVLFDYGNGAYKCDMVNEDLRKEFQDIPPCDKKDRNIPYEDVMEDQMVLLIVMICVPLLVFVIVAVVLFRRWWCIKYFCITVKNSAMLSIIGNEEKNLGTDGIYHYDVFVSYCNEDRAWVLDQLLPQVEKDCNVSVCLHERDFQVGLSILENIVSCMDRSRAIMLVLSQKFLLSQWCQFEMHLAQHRLLETRREDLILILLEDIPRRRRPHTLHYLMLTKTYIVWPDGRGERELFWRRVNRCLTTNTSSLRDLATDA